MCSSLVNFKLAACCLLETLLSSPTPSHRKPSFRDPCRPLALDLPVQPHPVTRSSLSLLTRSLWFPLSLYEPSSLTPPGELMHRALTLSPTPILSLIDPDHFLPDKTLFNRQPLLSSYGLFEGFRRSFQEKLLLGAINAEFVMIAMH